MIDLSEPAFPAELSSSGPQGGMGLRDYFAAKAMAALIARAPNQEWWPDFATDAYNMSDAMLAERGRK